MGLNPKAQAMTLLKMACNAGASNEALGLFSKTSATREGENAVDWLSVARQLQKLVATLPTAVVSTLDIGLLVEEEDGDELAA